MGDRQTPGACRSNRCLIRRPGFPGPDWRSSWGSDGCSWAAGRAVPGCGCARNAVLDMPACSGATDGYRFGSDAFRAWAQDIVDRFVGMRWEGFGDWAMHKVYVCDGDQRELPPQELHGHESGHGFWTM